MAVKFRRCPLFNDTLNAKLAQHGESLAAKYAEFLRTKEKDPMQKFGARDKPFIGDGILKYAIPGETLIHAHLSHDVNILYTLSGRNPTIIKLYGVFSHDELGTGQPPNIRKQKQVSAQLNNQSSLFDTEINEIKRLAGLSISH